MEAASTAQVEPIDCLAAATTTAMALSPGPAPIHEKVLCCATRSRW